MNDRRPEPVEPMGTRTSSSPPLLIYATSLFLLILPILLASCSILDPGEPGIRVTNRTDRVLHVLAWEMEASYTVDPIPAFDFQPGEIALLPPDASALVPPDEILGGYEDGDGVVLFVYEIEGQTAVLRGLESRSGKELKANGYRIRIREI